MCTFYIWLFFMHGLVVSNIRVGYSLICFGNNKNIHALFSTLRKAKTNVKTDQKHNSNYY